MTAENIRLIHGLMDSAHFPRLLDDFVTEEVAVRVRPLRNAVRDGNKVLAASLEGEIEALESLPKEFKKHAAKYEPND